MVKCILAFEQKSYITNTWSNSKLEQALLALGTSIALVQLVSNVFRIAM